MISLTINVIKKASEQLSKGCSTFKNVNLNVLEWKASLIILLVEWKVLFNMQLKYT